MWKRKICDDFSNGTTLLEYCNVNQWINLNNHHPIADTILYASVIECGKIIGNLNMAFAIYSLCQLILYAIFISACICYLDTMKIKYKARKVFFALIPFVPMYAINMVKDSTYSLFLGIWVIFYIEIVCNRCTKKGYISFIVFGLLASLTKNIEEILVVISSFFCCVRGGKDGS